MYQAFGESLDTFLFLLWHGLLKFACEMELDMFKVLLCHA